MEFQKLYSDLATLHGPMGWWPVRSECSGRGYHPGRAGIPAKRQGAFEVCMGAVLTQNTAWSQVEKALDCLHEAGVRDPEDILGMEDLVLAHWIRPAGYCNQKARYLKAVAQWFCANFDAFGKRAFDLDSVRQDLLKVCGVGPETADSILLYAFHLPTFVIDTYTRRICGALGIADSKVSYGILRRRFMDALPADVVLFQEFHALLVQHAKLYYSGKKASADCPLRKDV